MKRILYFLLFWFILSISLSVSSCQKDPFHIYDGEWVPLSFSLDNSPSAESGTRSGPIPGGPFPVRKAPYAIGMWLCLPEEIPEDFIPVRKGYDHLNASLLAGEHSDRWSYLVDGKTEVSLWVRRGQAVDLYAYYPYEEQSPGTSPGSVQVGVDYRTDLLWTGPLHLTALDTDQETVPISLPFKHAMSCIHLCLLSRYGQDLLLDAVKVTDRRSRLCSRAGFDILTGQLSPENHQKEWILRPSLQLQRNRKVSLDILIPPLADYRDGECILSFRFGDESSPWIDYPIPDTIGDRSLDEFLAGRRYIYELELDKSIYFAPVAVSDRWTEQQMDIQL